MIFWFLIGINRKKKREKDRNIYEDIHLNEQIKRNETLSDKDVNETVKVKRCFNKHKSRTSAYKL